jgi:hypothetical protein
VDVDHECGHRDCHGRTVVRGGQASNEERSRHVSTWPAQSTPTDEMNERWLVGSLGERLDDRGRR